MNSKHEFALFNETTSHITRTLAPQALFSIDDQLLVTRIASVLRMRVGDSFVMFDRHIHVVCTIEDISKKIVRCKMLEKKTNSIIKPSITYLLPVLKRDDLESALYAMVELGATSVQLVLTHKINRVWAGPKEFERAQRIMIAAAEQSKNYAFAQLHEPILLTSCLEKIPSNSSKVFFDVDGRSALSVMNELHNKKNQEIFLLVGPEADLTAEEKKLLVDNNFIVCELTPTVLRSVQAVALSLGMVRSVLK
ncbi:MAG: RsmE family RNA methyltransferase [Candidatus Babeliales bacterium]|nr:RsmE family RNA methyltransferase [Candidatus Babeliales bacterium]